MRIDQVIPTIVERDAVSAHTFEAQRVLHDLGLKSEIFALNIEDSLRHRVRPLEQLEGWGSSSHWLLYQASIGSPAAAVVAAHPSSRLVNYHNITPPALVGPFEPHLAGELALGRSQIRHLARRTTLGIAVSTYSEAELVAAGYPVTAVVPLLVDLAPRAEPDSAVQRRLGEERERGCGRWLFVGQFLPHKGQHAVVEALAFYRAAYQGRARLHLVGRQTSSDYAGAVARLVKALGLEDDVQFEGSVSESELAAFYSGADVFVCCSAHEGFCAPIIEAMHQRLPVVAFGAAAVPETLGQAGLVLPARTPSLVAAAVDRVLSDDRLRASMVEEGERRAGDFALERSRASFARAVEAAVRGQ
jgi:glycosyltransferase involved in cell wall biosynthesis